MGEDLGVAPGRESVATSGELRTEQIVVEDLTVLRSPDAAALVRERLMPVGDVDDAQAPRADCGTVGQIGAAIVRPPVDHRVSHCVQRELRHGKAPGPPIVNAPAIPHMDSAYWRRRAELPAVGTVRHLVKRLVTCAYPHWERSATGFRAIIRP